MKLECKTELTFEVQKEINRKTEIACKISVIIGAVGILCYIIGAALEDGPAWAALLLLFAIPLMVGIMNLISCNKINKNAAVGNRVFNYELCDDHLVCVETKGGEKVLESKIYYKDLYKVKQTQNYLLLYTGIMTTLPIKKADFSSTDFEMLLCCIKQAREKK